MFYTFEYEAKTLHLLKKKYIDNSEGIIFECNVGGLFKLVKDEEFELSQSELNTFIDEVNSAILEDAEEQRNYDEHNRSLVNLIR